MLKLNLDTSTLVKLRNGKIAIVIRDEFSKLLVMTKSGGRYWLNNYNDNLLRFERHDHLADIIAYKKYTTSMYALNAMLSEISELKWDWEREEKSDKEIELENLITTLSTQLEDAKTKLEKIRKD